MSTIPNDDELFAAIEANVKNWESVEVKFERIAIPGRGGWQVSFKNKSVGHRDNNGQGRLEATGGGVTLREAFANAFVDRVLRRIG